jgi:hypothetical protein
MSYRRTVLKGLEYRLDHLDRAGTITPLLLKAQPGSSFPHSPKTREEVFSEIDLPVLGVLGNSKKISCCVNAPSPVVYSIDNWLSQAKSEDKAIAGF